MSQHQDPAPHELIEEPALPGLGLSPATLTAIFVGGALGTVARYLLDTALTTAPGHFPSATLLINLSGSLLIGLLIPLTESLSTRVAYARPFLIVGVLGGWTTYSTLAVDGVQLARHGQAGTMVGYLAATVFGGIAAVLIGHSIGRRAARR